jgi:hypothetical protein
MKKFKQKSKGFYVSHIKPMKEVYEIKGIIIGAIAVLIGFLIGYFL